MASTSAPSSTATEAPAIEARDVSFAYPGARVGVRGASVAIAKGRITALIGPNGSGKSTLLALLGGRLRPRTGIVARSAEGVGFAAQHPELDPEMTGREHLALFASLGRMERGAREREVQQAIDAFGIEPFVDAWVGRMSGGMRRRVHLAVSTLGAPSVWLLDEPTTGLDPSGRAMLERAMRARVAEGCAVVFASHELGFAAAVADDLVFVRDGGIALAASVASVTEQHGTLDGAYASMFGDVAETAEPERGHRRGSGGGRGGRHV